MTVAAVMTYDSLVENIQSYLERTDAATLAKIPTFIMLAEQVIASQIKFLGNLTVNTSTMTQGLATIEKPAGSSYAEWTIGNTNLSSIPSWPALTEHQSTNYYHFMVFAQGYNAYRYGSYYHDNMLKHQHPYAIVRWDVTNGFRYLP
jgi:hypothetical protein